MGPKFFRLHICLFSVLTSFFPPFLMGDQPHFHSAHCVGGMFRELNIYYTYYQCQILIESLFVLIESNKC